MQLSLCKPLFLLVCLLSLGYAQQPAARAEDEAAVRAVALKYFETLAQKDLAGHMALWSGLNHEIEARRARLEKQLAEAEVTYSPPVLSQLKVGSTIAQLQVKTERRTRNLKTDVRTLTVQRLVFTFVKEEVWRIVAEQPAVANLVTQLSVKPETEWPKLLEAERDLVSPELLQLLVRQSDLRFTSGNYELTLKALRQVLLVAEMLNDRSALAGAWHHTGIAHYMRKDFAQALASQQKALALEQALNRPGEQARVLSSMALTFEALKQPQAALTHYQRALALFESANERGESATTLETIGTFFYEQGNYGQALEHLQRSLTYLAASEKQTFAQRSLKVARVAYEMGDDALALQHYRRALASFEQLGDHAQRGYTLHTLANLFYSQGDLGQALVHYQQSAQAEEQAENPGGIASALQGVGLVHSLNGNFALALPAYEKNLSISRTLKDQAQLAAALQKVAATRFALGEYATALQLYEETLRVREAVADEFEIARALLDVGITHVSLNQFAEAINFEERSRALFAKLKQPAGVANALLSLALVHYLKQDFTQSLAQAEAAATFAKQAGDNDQLWQARYRAGKCQQQLKQLPLARQALTEAVTLIEAQRPAPGQVQTNRLSENKLGPYLALIDVLIALNQGNEAFHFSERAKARGLLSSIRNGRVWITNTMTVAEQTRERTLLNEIGLLAAQLARENEKQQPNQSRVQELRERWRQARASYDAFLLTLFRAHPRLKSLRGEGGTLTAAQAATLVKDDRRALLAFSEAEDGVYLFVFTKADAKRAPAAPQLKIYALGTNRADLAQRLTRLQVTLTARAPEADAQLRELYELVLAPAQEQLQGKMQLVLAPDGLLWNLPFAALQRAGQEGSPKYLIEDYAVSYVPSCSAWQTMAQGGTAAAVRAGTGRNGRSATTTGKLLALANPALSEEVLQQFRTRLLRETFSVAAESETEITALAQAFEPANVQQFVGTEASETRVKTEAAAANWLHLAAPAVLDELNPFYSTLGLATAGSEDGLLTWREIAGLRLRAKLTVISAAESVPGRLGTGRAQVGTSWALFLAGCPALLLNQWPGDAAATSALLEQYYRQRLAQPTLSTPQIWQATVRTWLTNSETRAPFYWAGFGVYATAP